MDSTQIVIAIVSITLTLLIVVLGVQVWHILKEMKIGLQKVNKMLDDAGKVTGTVSNGIAGVGGFVEGIKTGLSVFTSLRHKGEEK